MKIPKPQKLSLNFINKRSLHTHAHKNLLPINIVNALDYYLLLGGNPVQEQMKK